MRISRRAFLRLSATALAGPILGGCATRAPGAPTPGPGGRPTPAPTSAAPAGTDTPVSIPRQRHQEAPMLRDLVFLGELPPVDDRLPDHPLVLEPNDRPGEYGGDLRMAFPIPRRTTEDGTLLPTTWREGLSAGLWLELEHLRREHLLTFGPDLTVRPGLAETWEYGEDGTGLTFRLRKGVRWSDGAPFTARDVLFWHNHKPGSPAAGDRVVAADDHTVIYRSPNVQELDTIVAYALFEYQWPEHYLAPFHPDLAPQEAFHGLLAEEYPDLRNTIKRGELDSTLKDWHTTEREMWVSLFERKASPLTNPEMPVLSAWRLERELDSQTVAYARNPYFWQTDPDGRQLPYVDHLILQGHEARDTFRMRVLSGELDYQSLDLGIADYEWLKGGELDGGYAVHLAPSTWHSTLHLNLATADERLRPLFGDVRVRRALMHAIDREELNRLYYHGLCTPRQFSPVEGSAYYYERLSQSYVEYDPDAANELLDEAGYTARDEDGYRLHPDGARISFEVLGMTQPRTADDESMMQILEYLARIGLEATYRRVDWAGFWAVHRKNELLAAWMPDYHFPLLLWRVWPALQGYGINHQPWAGGYGFYRYVGQSGDRVEPPEGHWIWELWEAIDRARDERDERRRDVRLREVLDIYAEQVPLIGVLGQAAQPQVVHKDLHNFRDGLPYDPQVRGMHLQNPQQLFWEHPEEHRYAV